MWQISLLGPLEVRRAGRPVRVPAGKVSQVLVHLALEAGVIVRADRLMDDLWPSGTASTRRNTLQVKVAQLRKSLGDPRVITSGDGGYALDVEPSSVDALAVLGHAVTAARLLAANDSPGAAELAASALKLFRGDLLPAAGEGQWVDVHRALLEEARSGLTETQLTARLRLGEIHEVIGELEEAVTTHPFQEPLWELLITALYRAGRQADALAAYQRVRIRLDEELGLEPGPGLQQLEQRILRHDDLVVLPARAAVSSGPDVVPPVGNLPSMSAELVGRSHDITAVTDLVNSNRLVEIIGPGGIGKTAVAIAVGRRLALPLPGGTATADEPTGGAAPGGEPPGGAAPGGVWLARLETAASANDVIDTVIAVFNVPGREDALFERLSGTALVLILDNCEHVLDAAAALAVRLLDAAPRLRILCTSQVSLDIDGETLFEVAPLPLPDAVELFSRRAGAQRLDRPSSVNADAVTDLCRSLDGLPLAIELAAARTRTLSITEIIRRLDDRFSVLSDPTSRRPERRRSLKSTIGWSYDLLFPDDQRGLWALSAFAGGAPLPAVEAVLAALQVPPSAAIDVVGRLASRSLIIVEEESDGPAVGAFPAGEPIASTPRYRLLDSIRAFAREAMTEAGMTEKALAAHAEWFAERAQSTTAGVRSSRQADHLAFVRLERANIDAALAWCAAHRPLVALDIVNGFGWAWVVLGDSRGAERIVAALDAVGDAGELPDRASALLLAAWIEASTGRLDLARGHIADATELAEAASDLELQARSSYYLAYVVSHHGEFPRAMELTERSDAIYSALDRPWDQAANWLFAARAAISAGDQDRSVRAVERVGHWLRLVDDPWLRVRADAVTGELARLQGRFDDAVVHIGRAAATSGRLGFLQTEAYQLSSLGRAQCQAGDYRTGASTLDLAVGKAEATGDVRMAALARVHLARVLRALGHTAAARAAAESATTWHRAAGGGEQAALGECLLAAMDAADGAAGAQERLRALLEDARRRDDAPVEVFALDALARMARASGDSDTDQDLSAAADSRMPAASHFITERDRADARMVRTRP